MAPLGVALLLGLASAPGHARTASDISIATVAMGRLYVVGTTEKPNTPVTLDDRFKTMSNAAGQFSFEEIYYPSDCIISVNIDEQIRKAVVSNCGQVTPIGRLPFTRAQLPLPGGRRAPPPSQAESPPPAAVARPRPAAKPVPPPVQKTVTSRPAPARRGPAVEPDPVD